MVSFPKKFSFNEVEGYSVCDQLKDFAARIAEATQWTAEGSQMANKPVLVGVDIQKNAAMWWFKCG